ncbi:MAG: flagellar biosynthesis anti-sigma factor FlgM [Planctomycetota bacterium]
MSDIAPINQSAAAGYSSLPGTPVKPVASSPVNRPSDRAEFSDAARFLAQLNDVPDIREDLVSSVKSAIDKGAYESPEKLDIAVDRLLDDLA